MLLLACGIEIVEGSTDCEETLEEYPLLQERHAVSGL